MASLILAPVTAPIKLLTGLGLEDMTVLCHGYVSESNESSTESIERKARTLYKACMDLDAIDKIGSKPLMDMINEVSV